MTYDPIDTSASDDSADSTVTVDDIDTTVLQGLNLDDAPAGGEVRITEENGQTVFSAGPPPGAYELDNYTFEKSLDISSQTGGLPFGVTFGDGGNIMLVADYNNEEIDQYTLSTPFDVSTGSYDTTLVLPSFASGPTFNDDGTKVYCTAEPDVVEFSLSSAFDIDTAGPATSYNMIDDRPRDIHWGDNGNKLYICGRDDGLFRQYSVPTPFDLSGRSLVGSKSVTTSEPSGLFLNPDGTRAFETGNSNSAFQYDLSTPFNITSATQTKSLNLNQGTFEGGIEFSDNGGKFYVPSRNPDEIRQFTL
jgi:hypothetical protein